MSAIATITVEPYISAKEVGGVLGFHEDHVYRLARQRIIPSYKIGRVRRFKLSEVLVWVESQQR